MNILIFYKHYPVAMGKYIHWGLEQAGHTVTSCGPYSQGKIPWGDFEYPAEYWGPPNIETPDVPDLPMDELWKYLGDFKPDVFIQASDNTFVAGKCPVKNILIGTDPHVIDYTNQRKDVDVYVSMQNIYAQNGYWMPYGYDPTIHKPIPGSKEKWDVVFIGLQYEHRQTALLAMHDAGLRVYSGLGHVYKEYVRLYNRGLIAFNYSSKDDLPARFWEGLAMRRLVLTNRVPDLYRIPFVPGEDYVVFDSIDEAVNKAVYYSQHRDEALKIARSGYAKVIKGNTYKDRVRKMLKDVG